MVFLVMLRALAWWERAGNGPGCAHGARATLSVQKEFAHEGTLSLLPVPRLNSVHGCSCAAQEAKQLSL